MPRNQQANTQAKPRNPRHHLLLALGAGSLLLLSPAALSIAQDNSTRPKEQREQRIPQQRDAQKDNTDRSPRRGGQFGPGLSHPERFHELMEAAKATHPHLADKINQVGQLPPEERMRAFWNMASQLPEADQRKIREGFQKMFEQRMASGFGGGRSPGHPGGGKWLTEENLDELVSVLQEIRPDWAESVTQLREQDRSSFFKAMRSNPELRRLAGLIALKDRAPETYSMRLTELKLSVKMQKLGYQAHLAKQSGDAQAISESQAALRETVEQYFDARIKLRKHEIQQVRAQLEQMEQGIQAAKDQRSSSIDEQLANLLSDTSFSELKKAQGPMQGPMQGPSSKNGDSRGGRDAKDFKQRRDGQQRWSSPGEPDSRNRRQNVPNKSRPDRNNDE